MGFVAFPIRCREGFLQRCDEPHAILSLISVMARTPHGSWAGSRHFGLRDFFEQARQRPELPQLALHELNYALNDLGIRHYRVESIQRETPASAGEDVYAVVLAAADGRQHRLTFETRY